MAKKNNKTIGTEFEDEFCKLLKNCGYWVHFMHPSASGSQPCDIVAAKDGEAYLFDCKTCKDNVFRIDRLEDNQIFAFYVFAKAGNYKSYIAIKHNDKVYLVSSWQLLSFGKVELTDEFLFEKQGFN